MSKQYLPDRAEGIPADGMLRAHLSFTSGEMIGPVIAQFPPPQLKRPRRTPPASPAQGSAAEPKSRPDVQNSRPPVTGVKPIPSFGANYSSIPSKRRRYDDAVFQDHYRPDVLQFSGSCRRGIRDPMGGSRDFVRHVRQDLNGRIPISHVSPLHSETMGADVFVSGPNPDALTMMWGGQVADLERRAHECTLAQPKRGECIPAEISAADGNSRLYRRNN